MTVVLMVHNRYVIRNVCIFNYPITLLMLLNAYNLRRRHQIILARPKCFTSIACFSSKWIPLMIPKDVKTNRYVRHCLLDSDINFSKRDLNSNNRDVKTKQVAVACIPCKLRISFSIELMFKVSSN